MEKLQGVPSAAVRWVLQTRGKDYSLRGGRQAVYCSVRLATQVLQKGSPERLFEAITEVKECRRVRKVIK